MSEKSWFAKNVIDFGSKKEESADDFTPPPSFSSARTPQTAAGNTLPAFQNPPAPPVPGTPQPTVSATADMEKFKAHIKEVMRGANQAGPDYYEFIEGVDANAQYGLPRPNLFIMSYNSLKPLGLTKEKLISSAQHYIQAIEQDYQNFQATVNAKQQSEVDGRQKQIDQLEQDNQAKMAQIQKLNEEINANNQQKQQLMMEKMEFESKFKASQSQMQIVVEMEKGRIKSDIETIQTTIQ